MGFDIQKICVSFGNISFEECSMLSKKYSFIELRHDLLNFSLSEYEDLFSSDRKIIFTIGIKPNTDIHEIVSLAIKMRIYAIDFNFGNRNEKDNLCLINSVINSQTKLIYSYHNFISGESKELIISKSEHMFSAGADIVKLVCSPLNIKEKEDLLITINDSKNSVIFGMNEFSKNTRIVSLQKGAPFGFCYPDEKQPTASGQFSYTEFLRLLNDFSE